MEWSASALVAWPLEVRSTKVTAEVAKQVRDTEVMRARMTDGASLERVLDGLVVADR